MTNHRSDHFFIYPKTKTGKNTGHTICVLLSEGKMYHGVAVCSETDQFTKAIGREIAYSRAKAECDRLQAVICP